MGEAVKQSIEWSRAVKQENSESEDKDRHQPSIIVVIIIIILFGWAME